MNKSRSARVYDASADREALGLNESRGGNRVDRSGAKDNSRGGQVLDEKNELQEQDEMLDELGQGVNAIHQISLGINDRIDDQRVMLEDIETGMNKANTNMEHVTRRTKALIDRAGGQRQFCIQICLAVVALVLLLLVIYT